MSPFLVPCDVCSGTVVRIDDGTGHLTLSDPYATHRSCLLCMLVSLYPSEKSKNADFEPLDIKFNTFQRPDLSVHIKMNHLIVFKYKKNIRNVQRSKKKVHVLQHYHVNQPKS